MGLRPADGGAHRYYDVGIEHLAFEIDSRDEVDAAHERCAADGAHIHHPPEVDRDIDDYYAFFVFDPDGMRMEIFAWPQARDPDWTPEHRAEGPANLSALVGIPALSDEAVIRLPAASREDREAQSAGKAEVEGAPTPRAEVSETVSEPLAGEIATGIAGADFPAQASP